MAFQKTKTDETLGLEIQKHLTNLKIETPQLHSVLSDQDKISQIEVHLQEVMRLLGLDLSDDSFVDTPKRIAKMFVLEYFWGLKPENFPKCTLIENKMRYDEMVCEKDIRVMSVCEHHFVTIDGRATVAYIPESRVIGLSKLNRIVEYFSRRPQVQERLTTQVAEALKYILKTQNVAISITAKHYCVISRGIEDQNSVTTTSVVSGSFRSDPAQRKEFYDIVNART